MDPQPHEAVQTPVLADGGPPPTVWQRAIAMFTRPTTAWVGLETRAGWWFPLVVMVVVSALFAAALHERAMLPMIMESWDEAVADGKMTSQQVENMEQFMSGPAGVAMTVAQQVVVLPLILLLSALFVWFGVGFVLGTRFKFRLAFEAVTWASLVTIPGQVLTGGLAWGRQTMRGIHTGFGILIPESDPATRLQTGLGFFLDAIGPLSIWYVAVLVIGAAALSGAPRKSVAWVVGGLYAALMVFFAALVAMMTRGS